MPFPTIRDKYSVNIVLLWVQLSTDVPTQLLNCKCQRKPATLETWLAWLVTPNTWASLTLPPDLAWLITPIPELAWPMWCQVWTGNRLAYNSNAWASLTHNSNTWASLTHNSNTWASLTHNFDTWACVLRQQFHNIHDNQNLQMTRTVTIHQLASEWRAPTCVKTYVTIYENANSKCTLISEQSSPSVC